MCGIAGIIGKRITDSDRASMREALAQLAHRGPDDERMSEGADWLLGFRRLSILDLSPSGNQPMHSLDGKAALVFNGEVYNYVELRSQLPADVTARSSGDAVVVLHLLQSQQESALPQLNGMFALAYVDEVRRRFILARDRLGVKPLYYTFHDGSLLFASELKPLLRMMGFTPEVDKTALNRYLQFGHIHPPLTIFSNVFKLPPGSYLTGDISHPVGAMPTGWWQLDNRQDLACSESDWLEKLDTLIADASRIRMRSDVPVGVFLSAGIDSGLVAHYVSQHRGAGSVRALTVGFDESDFSEAPAAAMVAKNKGLDHICIPVQPDDLTLIPHILQHCGEPFDDTSIINQYYLAKTAREHGIVFISGDGGDESFGGYSIYLLMSRTIGWMQKLAAVSAPWVPLLDYFTPHASLARVRLWKLSKSGSDFGALVRQNFRDPWSRELLHREFRVPREQSERLYWDEWRKSEGLPLVSRMQRFDLKIYMESDVLTKVDRASMAHSIEVRSPFLDYRVVELAAQIPTQLNFDLPNRRGKRLLRLLAARHLPPEVVQLPKKGFGIPIKRWIREQYLDSFEAFLFAPDNWISGCIDYKTLRKLFTYYSQNRNSSFNSYSYLLRVMMLELWARVILKNDLDLPLTRTRAIER